MKEKVLGLFEKIKSLIKVTPFVYASIVDMNLGMAIPITIFTMVMSRLMYSRTVLLWGILKKNQYFFLLGVVSLCSLQLLVYAITSKLTKKTNVVVATISVYVFAFGCFTVGQTIALYNYAVGKQAIMFLPMVFCIFTMMIIHPSIAIVGAIISFLVVPQVVTNKIALSVSLLNILRACAVMLVALSITRWYESLKNIRNSEKIAMLNEELSEMSITDELTNLKNRHGLKMDRIGYFGKKIIVAICDIDDFKQYNDTYGHDLGDDVIKRVADTLSEHFGRGNVYRFGGDEFIVITDYIQEKLFLQKLTDWKKDLINSKFDKLKLAISSTVGYSYGIPDTKEDFQKMFTVADKYLYKGKTGIKGTSQGGEITTISQESP